jgi:hypothetical protein
MIGGTPAEQISAARHANFSVRAATPGERQWFSEHVGIPLTDMARGIAAVRDDGAIRAMCVFDMWTRNAAYGHLAVIEPIAVRQLMRWAFRWFFLETGKGVLLGSVRASNAKALRLNKHLGFREAHRVKDGTKEGEDMILMEMRREECKWLKEACHG